MDKLNRPNRNPSECRSRSRIAWYVASFAWVIAVSLGMVQLTRYSQAAGGIHESPTDWPRDSELERIKGKHELVLFAHPQCACTHATIGELSRLLVHVGSSVHATVAFIQPTGTDWKQTSLIKKTESIPNVSVFMDDEGIETERFRARTSGLALLYSPKGRLLYQGGITYSRGHEGDNPGANAIRKSIGRQSGPSTFPVFGCPLLSPDELDEVSQ